MNSGKNLYRHCIAKTQAAKTLCSDFSFALCDHVIIMFLEQRGDGPLLQLGCRGFRSKAFLLLIRTSCFCLELNFTLVLSAYLSLSPKTICLVTFSAPPCLRHHHQQKRLQEIVHFLVLPPGGLLFPTVKFYFMCSWLHYDLVIYIMRKLRQSVNASYTFNTGNTPFLQHR